MLKTLRFLMIAIMLLLAAAVAALFWAPGRMGCCQDVTTSLTPIKDRFALGNPSRSSATLANPLQTRP